MNGKYSKKCEGHCPNCDSDNIDWNLESYGPPLYFGVCKDCGCNFQEMYLYSKSYFDEITSKNTMSDEEIENILNPIEEDEKWDEFEEIKDTVTNFLCDLPVEVYEHLFKVINKNPDKFVKYVLDYVE